MTDELWANHPATQSAVDAYISASRRAEKAEAEAHACNAERVAWKLRAEAAEVRADHAWKMVAEADTRLGQSLGEAVQDKMNIALLRDALKQLRDRQDLYRGNTDCALVRMADEVLEKTAPKGDEQMNGQLQEWADAATRAVMNCCKKCGGEGWLWGHELDNPPGDEAPKPDDTRYSCDGDACKAAGVLRQTVLRQAAPREPDYFGTLVDKARAAAAKATAKFPQPNYVTLKIAEEAGEVVRAAVHYGEDRMGWDEVEGEIVQLLAMLIRFVTEGDEVNGIIPPQKGGER